MTSNEENPDISFSTSMTSNPTFISDSRRKLRKLICLNMIISIICSITLFIRIYTNIISAKTKRKHDKLSYFIFEIIVMVLTILNAVLGLILAIFEQRKYQKLNFKTFNLIHLIFNMIGAIIFLFFFVIEFIRWWRDLLCDNQMYNSVRLVIIFLALVIDFCQTECLIENRLIGWSPKYRYSRFIVCFSSCLLIAISIVSIYFNAQILHRRLGVDRNNDVTLWPYMLLQFSSCFIVICGIIGVGLTFFYRKQNAAKNQCREYVSYFFIIFCIFGLILIISFTIILFSHHTKFANSILSTMGHTIEHSNLYISIVQGILLLIDVGCLYSLIYITRSKRNDLIIERIRLHEISTNYITYWSAAIDAFSSIPAGITGEAALQLMKAYENGQLENVECVVLRIGRLSRRIPILNNQTDDTEAIVLLTIVHHYDATVSSPLNSFWSTVLKRTLGSENCMGYFRPLVLRVGLIGYQWPFRTSIFFTAPHPEPLKRATKVLKTIIDWNEQQNSQMHCDFLVLPTLHTESLAKAIPLAGFLLLPFPPTHLLDLRPHHSKTWNEYMKTLKKGNRRPYIQQFLNKGGIIEEIHDLAAYEVADIVCKQWENIARMRRERKELATLAKPSIEFIRSIGRSMSTPYRSVLFLRFNNEVIASSVIYKFPHKLITTDIQGLTHEKARPLKAYFVMLQWVVREALDKKYDFIDFGATTPEPKIDLGCKSVAFAVGGYTRNPILAFGIQQSCQTLNIIHTQRTNQSHDSSSNDAHPKTFKNNPSITKTKEK